MILLYIRASVLFLEAVTAKNIAENAVAVAKAIEQGRCIASV